MVKLLILVYFKEERQQQQQQQQHRPLPQQTHQVQVGLIKV
jgi:hypothetical protein